MRQYNGKLTIAALSLMMVFAVCKTTFADDRVLLSDYPTLSSHIDQLRTWVEQRNASAIREQIAPDFITERDFGGSHVPLFPAWWNFANIYPFADRPIDENEQWWQDYIFEIKNDDSVTDKEGYIEGIKSDIGFGKSRFIADYVEASWVEFLVDLPVYYLEKQGDEDSLWLCGEARPLTPLAWTPDDGLSMNGQQAYVEVELLNIRQKPSLNSAVVGQQEENNIVEVESDTPTSDLNNSYRWLKVRSPWDDADFTPGYVPARYLSFTFNQRICFGNEGDNSAWRIVAVEKAGE